MRPRSLEIEGFNSFKQKRRIDFSDLQIFSITGENGAGKSTLLEAIVFALYGETPRFSKEKKDLVSIGNNELNVLFEFSIGKSIYRVGRRFKLKGAPYVSIEKFKKGDWVTLGEGEATVDDQIRNIIRMSARAFMQSVIIPQGRFDMFLRPAKPKERTDTLTEMFHLEIYERMRERAADIARKAKDDVDRLANDLGGFYADATPETLQALKAQRDELLRQEKEVNDRAKELKEKSKRISTVLKAKRDLQGQMEKCKRCQDELDQEDKNSKQLQQRLDQWHKNEEPQLEQLNAELDGLPSLLQSFKELDRLERDQEKFEKRILEETRELKSVVKSIEEADRSVQDLQKLHEKAVQKIAASKFDEIVWKKLDGSRDDLAELRSVRQRMKENRENLKELEERTPVLKACVKQLQKSQELLKQSLRDTKESMRLLGLKSHVQELQKGLTKGDQCPVCKSTVEHAYHPSSLEMNTLEKQIQHLSKTLEALETQFEKANREHASTEAELSQIDKDLLKVNTALESFTQKQNQIEKVLIKQFSLSQDLEIVSFLTSELKRQEQQRKEHSELVTNERTVSAQLQRAQIALEQADAKVKSKNESLEDLNRQLKERNTEAEEIRKQQNVQNFLIKGRTIHDAKLAGETRQKELRDLVSSIHKKGQDLQTGLGIAAGRISMLSKSMQSEQNELRRLETIVSEFSNEEKRWDESTLTFTERDYEETIQEQRKRSVQLGQINTAIESLQERIKQVATLTRQKKDAEKQRDLYGQLASYLEVRRLQKYVVAKLMDSLVANANVYLKELTENKYQLVVVKEDLLVRDMWNGGVERSTKGLSGGETFVISLALALALSSAIGHGVHMESLFLDEGFGSLDKGRLELVRDALLKLPQYEKVVGVVTHIDDFAKTFPNQFLLTNTADGTQVTRVTGP